LLEELAEALRYPKFERHIWRMSLDVDQLMCGYAGMALLAAPAYAGAVMLADPDDQAVLACALGCAAQPIVSGNRHLLDLKTFREIPILSPAAFLELPSLRE